jgi:hypothetical protein
MQFTENPIRREKRKCQRQFTEKKKGTLTRGKLHSLKKEKCQMQFTENPIRREKRKCQRQFTEKRKEKWRASEEGGDSPMPACS